MPKNITLPDPDPATTIGTNMTFVRVGAGAAGVLIRYDVPTDPGTFETTAAALSASSRTALQTIHAELVSLWKAAKGYT